MCNMLRIEPFVKEKHSESLLRAFKSIFHESEQVYLNRWKPTGPSFVCLDRKKEICAFTLVQESAEGHTDFEMSYLGVMPRYRGKGYARRLIELVKTRLGEAEKGLWLTVLKSNTKACELYKKVGFEIIERFKVGGPKDPPSNSIEDESTEEEDAEDEGFIFIWGVEYACYICKETLTPSKVIWGKYPVRIMFTGYGPRQIEETVPFCWHCRPRVEGHY